MGTWSTRPHWQPSSYIPWPLSSCPNASTSPRHKLSPWSLYDAAEHSISNSIPRIFHLEHYFKYYNSFRVSIDHYLTSPVRHPIHTAGVQSEESRGQKHHPNPPKGGPSKTTKNSTKSFNHYATGNLNFFGIKISTCL